MTAARAAVRLEPWGSSPYLQLALVDEQAGDSATRTPISAQLSPATPGAGSSSSSRPGSRPSPVRSRRPGGATRARGLSTALPALSRTTAEYVLAPLGPALEDSANHGMGGTGPVTKRGRLSATAGVAEPLKRDPKSHLNLRFVASRSGAATPFWRRLLALADLLAGTVFLAVYAAHGLALRSTLLMIAALPLWLIFAKLAGLYLRS